MAMVEALQAPTHKGLQRLLVQPKKTANNILPYVDAYLDMD